MSEFAVRLSNVSKSYVVWSDRRYWLAEFLGLKRLLREGHHFRTFWALRDIDLEIPRGAKVALVGRNGAGKSTLLRIVSENVAPTLGTVEVNGHCEALMQLGAGFNPEFTGRQNIFAALGYMGLTGAAAEEKVGDILDFSELEEFIDQPIRTYSSGMYLRLAFSVATVIAPQILIIDEILGAGDLYFQAKCLDRMADLTRGPGTTVLFVSHDLESAHRLCDTWVWLDRGRIQAMGPGSEIRALYEDSIRRQQEVRLRARNLRLRAAHVSDLPVADQDGLHLFGQLVHEGPEDEGPSVSSIRLLARQSEVSEIRVGDALDDDAHHYPSFVFSAPGDSAWGAPSRGGGRRCRPVLRPRGNVTGAKFALHMPLEDFSDSTLVHVLEVTYRDTCSSPARVDISAGALGLKTLLRLEHAADGAWKTARTELPRWTYRSLAGTGSGAEAAAPSDAAAGPVVQAGGVPAERRFGTGQVTLDRVRFLDPEGQERFLFQSGRTMTIETSYTAHDAEVVGRTMLLAVGFERKDGLMASTMISTLQECRFPIARAGRLSVTMEPLLLMGGEYRVSILILSELDLFGFSPHFTRSPFIFDMHRLAYEVAVEAPYPVEIGVYRQPVRWESLEYQNEDPRIAVAEGS